MLSHEELCLLWEVGSVSFKMFGPVLGRCNGGLFIMKFSFVYYKVCQVLNGILVYVFHESFDVGFWYYEVG